MPGVRFPSPPAAPLRLTTAVQNRVLVGEACEGTAPHALRALLRYDLCFTVAAIGWPKRSSRSSLAGPFRVTGPEFKLIDLFRN